jgi:hypothetical protein
MAGKGAAALGAQRAAKLGQHAQAPFVALVIELVRPER